MTLSSLVCPIRFWIGRVFVAAGVLLLVGCGGAGSKQASLYQRLTTDAGTWTIERLEGDRFDYETRLDETYPEGVRITFRETTDGRSYTVNGRHSDGETTQVADGRVGLLGEESLQMRSVNEQRSVTWQYGFEASRAQFSVRTGSQAFLNALFPEGGRDVTLEMTLAPQNE